MCVVEYTNNVYIHLHAYVHMCVLEPRSDCGSFSSWFSQDICRDPKLFVGGGSRFDVKQGILGDCWLLAAIASLAEDNVLLRKVIPYNQEFESR